MKSFVFGRSASDSARFASKWDVVMEFCNLRGLLRLLMILPIVWLGLAPVQAQLDPTTDKILYEVANAHLDTQWNWTIQQTINSYVPNTLHANFGFFENYPHYTFSFEGAFRYQLAKEYYPDDYATLKNYVAQGRWHVGGSVVDAGDVNVPSPEALMRQILYGNGFWQEEFGKTSVDIFLPDCFGFGYTLPSIAAHCGLKGFSSQKLSWGSAISLPFQNIGRWVGPDGNSVVAVIDPGSYTSTIGVNLANDASALNRINTMGAATGLYIDYRYFGTGDTGGGPTQGSVDWLEQSVTTAGAINVISAYSDQMFRDLTPAHISLLPTYQGELLMRTHGTGCYTSHPEMKQYNRQNEQRADAAERISVMADWLQGGDTYPKEKLNKAWERFLWHQFHDDLTGTSIPEAYAFSWNDELLSLNEFNSTERHGAGMVAQALDTTAVGLPIVVYNPLSIAREDIVEAVVTFSNTAPTAVQVYDGNGTEVPSQSGAAVGNKLPVTFLAAVPATGVAVFDVRPAALPSTLNTGLSVSTSQLENARYRVQINANGDVSSIYDKSNSRELLNAPIRWAFLADTSTSWPAWEIMYSALTAAPTSYLGGTPVSQVVENGPARVAFSIARHNAGSLFTENIRLAAGGAGDRVEWSVAANWGTRETLLKVTFPLTATNANATYDLGLGTIQRPNSTSSLYEVPAQQWADLTKADSSFGATIINDSRYGWDKPDNSTLRMTVFHTPAVGSSYTYQATNGFGSHQFGFAVMGHASDWRQGGSPWVAARFNQPLQAFQTTPHAGTLGKSFGFLSCNNSNVMVKAVKRAENSNEIIVRLQELSGQSQSAQLTCAALITNARQVTGAEASLNALTPVAGKLNVSLGAYAPMTVALTLAAPGSPVTKPASQAVALPYNLDAVSTDGNRTDGDFENGYTYPAELFPATLVRDGITFQLGPTNNGAVNAVSCQGQSITLPAGYDRVYLLAAASSNDLSASFQVGGQVTNLLVPYFTGFFGQWNPPSLKPAEVGWVGTHRHTGSGNNDAYRFCFLFKYCLTIPAGATTLTLPNSPNVRVFAVSVGRNTSADTIPAGGLIAANLLPWAEAGGDRTINANSNTSAVFKLDGHASVDPDGSIVAYDWSEGGVSIGTGAQPTVTLGLGSHTILLTVTDDQGGTGQDVLTITVLPPLNVTITASPTNASVPPLTVNFTGQASGSEPIVPGDTTDDLTGTISAQGENSPSETSARAFDNSSSSKWLDFANSNPSTRASWLQYQYANAQQRAVTSYTLTSANDSPARDPADWQLLGSNDGGATWTVLDVRTSQTFSARFQKRTFTVASPAAYNVYRLQIDKVANPASANSVQLAELELIGLPAFAYYWSFGDGATSTEQNPKYSYTGAGIYRATLGVTFGIYTGTNSALITIGSPLAASLTASRTNGAAPMTVQFTGAATGGNGVRAPYDTTEDHYGTITVQGENPPGETAAKAFDDSASTKWLDFANAFPETRSTWIQYQYANGTRCLVTSYTVTSAGDAMTYSARNPRDWRLLGSNDDGASWVTVDTRTGETFTANQQKRTFTAVAPAACKLYRFVVDSVANPASANSMQLAELELIGRPAYNFLWSFGDGFTSTEQNPQHTYTADGSYLVQLTVSDGAAVVANSTTVNVLPLNLTITSSVGGSMTLTWPGWADNVQLYATTNLAPPVAWLPVTNVVQTVGDLRTVTLDTSAATRFFRLATP